MVETTNKLGLAIFSYGIAGESNIYCVDFYEIHRMAFSTTNSF